MTGPRDSVAKYAVPVNPINGEALSDAQLSRIDKVKVAYDALIAILHECEGTSGGDWGSRKMAIAATQIELGVLMAFTGCLESR